MICIILVALCVVTHVSATVPFHSAATREDAQQQQHIRPRLIVDTDMGFDVDDVAAVCLANVLHDQNRVELIAVVHNTGCRLGVGGISSIVHFYGNDDNVTIGAWKGSFGSDCDTHFQGAFGQNQYLQNLVRDMGGPIKDASDAMRGTDAYRRVLSESPDKSVHIASIGMPTNLRDLLKTDGDEYSPLSGVQLVAKKVAKIVFMDGPYNFGCAAGFIGQANDCYGSARDTLEMMPDNVRLVFSGKGADPDIYSGSGLQRSHPSNSPCREAFKDWCCNPNGQSGGKMGRLSWDPIAVMIAALDVGSVYEKEVSYGTQVTADADGTEHFFGSGTMNARTDFSNATSSPASISSAIDTYLNMRPGQQFGWTLLLGHNCYGDRDGTGQSHGATDLEHPPSSAAGPPMTIRACQESCLELDECTAVTTSDASGNLVNCYRKSNVEPDSCDQGTSFNTYLHP